MSFTNVEIKKAANIYHGGKVTSRTIVTAAGERKTLGVMLPGVYEFTTGAPEVIDVTRGVCRVKIDAQTASSEYRPGDSFPVPEQTRFEIEVIELLDYVCHFG